MPEAKRRVHRKNPLGCGRLKTWGVSIPWRSLASLREEIRSLYHAVVQGKVDPETANALRGLLRLYIEVMTTEAKGDLVTMVKARLAELEAAYAEQSAAPLLEADAAPLDPKEIN